MKKFSTYLALLLALACALPANAQNRKIDSLRKVIRTSAEDTNKVNALSLLAWKLSGRDPDTSIVLCTQSFQLAEKKQWKKGIAGAARYLGIFYSMKGDYKNGLPWFEKGISVCSKVLSSSGDAEELRWAGITLSTIYGNLGIVYKEQGSYPKALEYCLKALKLCEKLNDSVTMGKTLGNIGNIYDNQGEMEKALDFYTQALHMQERMHNSAAVAVQLFNIGNEYQRMGKLDEAYSNYQRALSIDTKSGNKNGQAFTLGSLAELYEKRGWYDSAFACYSRALKLEEQLGNSQGLARYLGNTGALYLKLGKLTEAASYLQKALPIAESIGDLEGIRNWNQYLGELHEKKGEYEKAFAYFKKYIAARDSLVNEENTKKTVQAQMQYEFDKKEAEAKANQEKKDAVAAADARRQKIILWSVVGGLLLVIGFALFIYRSYREKQKANVEISLQKQVIEEKQKEILDSIHYAKRIQRSLLPRENYIHRKLNRS